MSENPAAFRFAAELAAVPLSEVARLAGSLTDEKTSASEALREAYRLLTLTAETQALLRAGRPHDEALAWQEVRAEEAPSQPIVPRDAQGQLCTVPFDEALLLLMPELKKVDRMPRYRRWLQAAESLTVVEAGDKIASLQRDGIPPIAFQCALRTFAFWLREEIRQTRARAGAKGGKVSRRKKRP